MSDKALVAAPPAAPLRAEEAQLAMPAATPPVSPTPMHVPVRPGWQCGACGLPWPCGTRRRQLLAEYDGAFVSLAVLMGSYLVDASVELPSERAGDLYDRFLGWVRPLPPGRHGDRTL